MKLIFERNRQKNLFYRRFLYDSIVYDSFDNNMGCFVKEDKKEVE